MANTKKLNSRGLSGLSQTKKMLVFILAFAVAGGAWFGYKSFAEVNINGCYAKGSMTVGVRFNNAKILKTNQLAKVMLVNFKKPYYGTLAVGSSGPCVLKYQETVNQIMGQTILKQDSLFKQKDSDVAAKIQNWLQNDGQGIDLVGTYTGTTKTVPMTVNGRVDPITWAALDRAHDLKLYVRTALTQ